MTRSAPRSLAPALGFALLLGACAHSTPDRVAANGRSAEGPTTTTVAPTTTPTSTIGEPSALADRLANSIPDDIAYCADLRDPAHLAPGVSRLEVGKSLAVSNVGVDERAAAIDVLLADERFASVPWGSAVLGLADRSEDVASAVGLGFEFDRPVRVPTVLGTVDLGDPDVEGDTMPTLPDGYPVLRPLTPSEEDLFGAAHEVGVVIDMNSRTVRAVAATASIMCRIDPDKRWSE